MKIKFLRRTSNRYSKLGKRRKKKQIWRRPTGRDNKMREKRKNRGAVVSIGYKKQERKYPFIVRNLEDLKKVGKNEMVILGNAGRKKKAEIIKKAQEMKINFENVNSKKFLKEAEKKKKLKQAKKEIEEQSKKTKAKEKKK